MMEHLMMLTLYQCMINIIDTDIVDVDIMQVEAGEVQVLLRQLRVPRASRAWTIEQLTWRLVNCWRCAAWQKSTTR